MPVKNIIPGQRVTKQKLERAKELRHEMTPAEKILWQELRANKLGIHFRRHTAPAGGAGDRLLRDSSLTFTATPSRSYGVFDKAALVVEVDGDVHDLQQEEDATPSAFGTSPKYDKKYYTCGFIV